MGRVSGRLYAGTGLLALGAITTLSLRHSRGVDAATANGKASFVSWTSYGGSNSDAQYTALKQVNRSNAGQLQLAWFYPSGNNGFRYGSNPLV
ncbi:MAG TPA: hypothetical protein VGG95_07510, partial [Edaphobacter sp.]